MNIFTRSNYNTVHVTISENFLTSRLLFHSLHFKQFANNAPKSFPWPGEKFEVGRVGFTIKDMHRDVHPMGGELHRNLREGGGIIIIATRCHILRLKCT